MSSNAIHHLTVYRQIHMLYRLARSHYHRWFHDDLSEASQSLSLEETRLPRLLKLSIFTLSGATFMFLFWASLTPVKELARTEGQVLTTGYSQLVQHLEGGLVRKLLVHEGDFVQKGQIVMELDGAGLEEDFRQQQALVSSLSLQAERLQALLQNREPDFSKLKADEATVKEQKRMYETARDSLASELAVLDEQIAQRNTAISRIEKSLGTAQSNLKLSREGKNIYSNLEQKGLVARTASLKKQEEVNSREGDVNSLTQQLEEGKRELKEFERRREALSGQRRDDAYNELHKLEADIAQAKEDLKKRNDRVGRLEVRTPVSGYVKGLKINTIGSVIPAGQTLMEIVPVDEQLILEVRILPQQVGRVAVGQEVQAKVDSYDYVRFGTIDGKLESISAMTFVDELRRQEYYKGRVRLSRNYAGSTPGTHLIMPGMTADADIVTGEKSVLGYLLKPIQVAMHNAMTEQ